MALSSHTPFLPDHGVLCLPFNWEAFPLHQLCSEHRVLLPALSHWGTWTSGLLLPSPLHDCSSPAFHPFPVPSYAFLPSPLYFLLLPSFSWWFPCLTQDPAHLFPFFLKALLLWTLFLFSRILTVGSKSPHDFWFPHLFPTPAVILHLISPFPIFWGFLKHGPCIYTEVSWGFQTGHLPSLTHACKARIASGVACGLSQGWEEEGHCPSHRICVHVTSDPSSKLLKRYILHSIAKVLNCRIKQG